MTGQDRDLSRTPPLREQYAAFASWLALLCQALETSIVVFLRKGFGERYFGGQAAAVIPLILVYSLAWEGQDPTDLMCFLGLYLLGCVMARAGSARAARRGEVVHSHYSGWPIILDMRPFRGRLSERSAKATVEPLLVFAVGLLLMELSEPLGCYLLMAAGGLAISMRMAIAYERQLLLDARDAYLAQRRLAERVRRGGW